MKLTIPRKELNAALGVVKTAAARGGTLPILANVALFAKGKSLNLVATDLDVFLRLRADATIKEEGEITVRAQLLADIAATCTSDNVSIELKKNLLHVACGEFSSRLGTLPLDDFPPMPTTIKDAAEFELAEHELHGALASTAFAMAAAEERQTLTGTLLEFISGELHVVTCDGRRVARVIIEATGPNTKIARSIPAKAAKELLRLLDTNEDKPGKLKIAINDKQAKFTFGDVALVTKLIEGNYPNYRGIIPEVNAKAITTIGRGELLGCIERCDLVADASILTLSDKTLEIQSSQTGDRKDMTSDCNDALLIPCRQNVTVKLTNRFLLDGLRAARGDEVEFYCDRGLVLLQVASKNWTSVLAALKDGPDKPATK